MIVVMAPHASEQQVKDVEQRIADWGYGVHPIYGTERTVIGAVGVPEADKQGYMEQLESLDYVDRVVAILRPFKFVSREFHSETTRIPVGDTVIGGDRIVYMAGPCTIENHALTLQTAWAVKSAGASILRGGAYKPCTSPYSFPGLGEEGLRILRAVGDETGLAVITEAMDPRHVDLVCEFTDIIQIGTRSMQNYDLLREVGRTRKPVVLKRGMWARIDEWLQAAEYIFLGGNHQVILCERGIRTFETHTRNTLDLAAVPAVKHLSHLPVIVDPSHGTGKTHLVSPMVKAAIACGADGVIVEVHPDPSKAMKDGAQSQSHEQFADMVSECEAITRAVGRTQ